MANDFSGDANCVALWNFENGALTVDSKGGNTLVNTNVVANLVDFKQGSASADHETTLSARQVIADAALDAGFPLKNGDANKKISFCVWFQLESVQGAFSGRYFAAKYDTAANKRSIAIGQYNDAVHIHASILIGHTGGTAGERITHGGTILATGKWYHLGFTFQDSDKSYRIRVWDEDAASVTETTGNTTNNINVEDAEWRTGGFTSGGYHDGELDEMVVFNDILSAAEIDEIRQGIYAPGAAVTEDAFFMGANV